MTQASKRRLALILVVALIASAVAPMGVAAQTDDGDTGLLEALTGKAVDIAEDPVGAAKAASAFFKGAAENIAYANPLREPKRDARQCALDIQSEFNANNETYIAYANERIVANTDYDTVRIRCETDTDDGDNGQTVFFVADINQTTGNVTSAEIVNETSRSVDKRVTLSGLAAEEGPDDLVDFREEYVETNTTPEGAFGRRMAGKYAGHVEGTFDFIGGDE
ncbi:hypothetical protein [Haloferax sulfurifontis]|uniref:Uncharacterized protein n=2 Tax=Haloferax sulfurifontis TaxID=255616 RepID=M0III6_9EURY|nr:hypothetical protein [Haloferax sulfurifontis]ELZ96591.1 hypothetical protein C441_04464 [Haloferax sulfurifontis ATCC BAA-897]GGC72620.1 hypothetical protein GCM10007209_38220 [Haloferax sulfurifontis]